MRTCLEVVSMDSRHTQEVRSDYQRTNQYSETHPNALGGPNADAKGKGTHHFGHSHYLPNCSGQIGVFNLSNFDTAYSSHPGNNVDNATREVSMVRSLYTPDRAYSARLVDTSANVREGQYQVP